MRVLTANVAEPGAIRAAEAARTGGPIAERAPAQRMGYDLQMIEDLKAAFHAAERLPEPEQQAVARDIMRLKRLLRTSSGASIAALSRHNVDLVLAAAAIVDGWTLVSNDAVFPKLATATADLTVENWTQSP